MNARRSFLNIVALFSSAVLLFSLAEAKQQSKFLSNRPLTQTKEMVLVRLESDSLLYSHYQKRGAAQAGSELDLDEDLKKQIQKEQTSFIQRAKKLSSEIDVIYRYQYVMNALALAAPKGLVDHLENMSGVLQVQKEPMYFRPPKSVELEGRRKTFLQKNGDWYTSADHIRATWAHENLDIRGEGIRVGIVDSGIDYTHAMLGGSGDPADFESIDPAKPTRHFPNQKVVGGRDFVGSTFNPASVLTEQVIPRPDANPLDDTSGHGTHVAGTVAGVGDGEKTYSGVAPKADLYALKVFGAGSTMDYVVAAAFEYAMDPNGDGDVSDRLDVLNLSLGGNFGKPSGTYEEVVKNAVRAGMTVVSSAGNSGDQPFIIGSPATTKEAISVAASVDGMEHNWKFPAVTFQASENEWLAKRIEAAFTKPIDQMKDVKGKLVYAGEAAEDFSDELKERLKGNIAFIKRGSVTFVKKVNRAYEAGARGVVVFNNEGGDPIVMGGESDKTYEIPAIMIDQSLGNELVKRIKLGGEVKVRFKPKKVIQDRDRIDRITDFSSYGPRSGDALLKPEVSAPGFQIISARAGSGDQAARMNGTSMSSPHVAGVMALMVERYPEKTASELKTLLMNSTTPLKDEQGESYPVTVQGAGLVNVKKALTQQLEVSPAAVSLGIRDFPRQDNIIERTLSFELPRKDLDLKALTYEVEFAKNMDLSFPSRPKIVTENGKRIVHWPVKVRLNRSSANRSFVYHEAVLALQTRGGETLARIPFFALGRQNSRATMEEEKGEWVFKNRGNLSASVMPFLKMGEDERKPTLDHDLPVKSRGCDLRRVFARVVKKDLATDQTEEKVEVLEVGVFLEEAVSFWEACDVSLTFDSDNDGKADVEALGILGSRLEGLRAANPQLASTLGAYVLDADKVRNLRRTYEEQLRQANQGDGEDPALNFLPAIKGVGNWQAFSGRRLSVLTYPLSTLPVSESGKLNLTLTVTNNDGGVMWDDVFADGEVEWDLTKLKETLGDLPGTVELPAKDEVRLPKNEKEDLRWLVPQNSVGKEILAI